VSNLESRGAEVKLLRLDDISANFHLLYQLTRRDVSVRFTGSALGFLWAILQPLTLVALYWLVFTVMIPGGRLGSTAGPSDYVAFLVSGLIPWLGIHEGIMRSTTSIVENGAVVRRLPLKSEILVLVPNLTAVAFQLIAIILFSVLVVARGHSLRSLWILPFAILLQLMLQAGIGLILATLFVFFRDVVQILGFFLSIVFYLSPILYLPPERFANFFLWNPLTPLLGLFRSAMLDAPLPEGGSIVFLLVVAIAVTCSGLWLFRQARPTLTDLI
jgi:lipopolysaccharide transport system permease protein